MQYLVIGFALISAVLIRAAPSETEIGTYSTMAFNYHWDVSAGCSSAQCVDKESNKRVGDRDRTCAR